MNTTTLSSNSGTSQSPGLFLSSGQKVLTVWIEYDRSDWDAPARSLLDLWRRLVEIAKKQFDEVRLSETRSCKHKTAARHQMLDVESRNDRRAFDLHPIFPSQAIVGTAVDEFPKRHVPNFGTVCVVAGHLP